MTASRPFTRLLHEVYPRSCSSTLPLSIRGTVTKHLPTSTISRRLSRHNRRVYSAQPSPAPTSRPSSNPELTFPCLDAADLRSATLTQRTSSTTGPEPSYTTGAHKIHTSIIPLSLDWGGTLREHAIAYETWGTLNAAHSNAILLHTGLSASSHAKSTPENPQPGWWESFIGPGAPLDTDKYFVICTNVLGSCYGSTGPSSVDPANGERYATRFPILTMEDMVRAQMRLVDALGIERLYASVGASMGGMQSLAAGLLFSERVGRLASISGCARSHPYSIALRHVQRQVLMMDPNWRRGHYYGDGEGDMGIPPHSGMKLAREIATVTYRSGPEWEKRFGRRRADPEKPPALCPDFLIETYLDHAGEKWCLQYDPNSLLYISKAMDLFDLGKAHRDMLKRRHSATEPQDALCTLTLPEHPYEEMPNQKSPADPMASQTSLQQDLGPSEDLVAGMEPLKSIPTLVMGVASDILFPSWQQYEVAQAVRRTGNRQVTHVELGQDKSLFGHDTFLLDLENIGGELRKFLG